MDWSIARPVRLGGVRRGGDGGGLFDALSVRARAGGAAAVDREGIDRMCLACDYR
jgi:hypothetical protein